MLTLEFVFEKRMKFFGICFNRLKNIVNMHREHDVLGFFKHRQKHRGQCFFKTSPKNRLVKNLETLHR